MDIRLAASKSNVHQVKTCLNFSASIVHGWTKVAERGEGRERDGAAGALALALEVPKLCSVLLAKLLPGQLYHEKQKFAVKAKVNAASNRSSSSSSNNTVGH